MRTDHAAAIKSALVDVAQVCHELGLTPNPQAYRRQAAGLLVRCPVHEDRTPSCSVQERDGALVWKCHGCDQGGDVLELVAAVRGLSTSVISGPYCSRPRGSGTWGPSSRSSRFEAATRAGNRGKRRLRSVRQPPIHRSDPTPQGRKWPICGLQRCPFRAILGVAEYLAGRAIAPEAVEALDLARVLPEGLRLPWWASYRGDAPEARTWLELGYRLIVPMFDAEGSMRLVRAWRVGGGDGPKRLPPSGHRASGLVMADNAGRSLLGSAQWQPGTDGSVLIVEGEPDFLTWATRFSDGAETVPAVLGITSGSWTSEIAARIPKRARRRPNPSRPGRRQIRRAHRCDARRSVHVTTFDGR